jgi:hypothetical protein
MCQGFRALLMLLHVCVHVEVYGFSGSIGWYYNKRINRSAQDKALHRGLPAPDDNRRTRTAKNDTSLPISHRQLLASLHIRVRSAKTPTKRAAPSGHKLRVERACMQQLASRKLFTQRDKCHRVGVTTARGCEHGYYTMQVLGKRPFARAN